MKISGKILLISLALMISMVLIPNKKASAQFFTGGEFSVNFLGNITVDVAPIVGYKIQNFRAGLSPVIMYTATGNTEGDLSYGGRVYGEYLIYQGFFGHAEFEVLNTGHYNWTALQIQHDWVMGAPIGVGYEREITNGVWFKTMVLYDALMEIDLNQTSAKANPTVRGGIVYQF